MRPATRSVNPSRYSSLARRSTVRDRSTRSTVSPLVPSGALRCLISNTSEFGTSDPRQPLLALVLLPFGQCPPWADGRWGWTEEAVCIFMARSARVEVFRFSRRVGDSNLFHISCPWEGCFSASQGRKGRESRSLFFLRVLFCTKRKRDSHRRCGPPWLPSSFHCGRCASLSWRFPAGNGVASPLSRSRAPSGCGGCRRAARADSSENLRVPFWL